MTGPPIRLLAQLRVQMLEFGQQSFHVARTGATSGSPVPAREVFASVGAAHLRAR